MNMNKIDEYSITQHMCNTIRRLNEAYNGNYNGNNQDEEVITDEQYNGLFTEVTKPIITTLSEIIIKDNGVTVNKEKNTITVKGEIPILSDLSFIITTDISSVNGMYISVDALNITDEAITILSKLYGISKNFISQWNSNNLKKYIENL